MHYNFNTFTKIKSISLLMACILLFFTGSLINCNMANGETLLFPDIKAWDLKSLRVSDNNNGRLDFKRKMCLWTLGKEALATNELRVTDLAEQITGLAYEKYIPGQESKYANYMVGEKSFNYKIDFSISDGVAKSLYLGSDNNSTILYARPYDDEAIYVLSMTSLKNINMEIDYWLPEKE